MNNADFVKVAGVTQDSDYTAVAGILQGGYGFAGYYNGQLDVNRALEQTCVLINVRLVNLQATDQATGRPGITDFNQFIEEIVLKQYLHDREPEALHSDFFGKSIPLVALPLDQIVALYPVAQMGRLMEELHREKRGVPSFLDFNDRSIVLRLLRAKLW